MISDLKDNLRRPLVSDLFRPAFVGDDSLNLSNDLVAVGIELLSPTRRLH
jgi:hypothetical protein